MDSMSESFTLRFFGEIPEMSRLVFNRDTPKAGTRRSDGVRIMASSSFGTRIPPRTRQATRANRTDRKAEANLQAVQSIEMRQQRQLRQDPQRVKAVAVPSSSARVTLQGALPNRKRHLTIPIEIPESSGSLYWEMIADEIKAEGWSVGWVRAYVGKALLWSVDANKGDGRRFIARAEELATATAPLTSQRRSLHEPDCP